MALTPAAVAARAAVAPMSSIEQQQRLRHVIMMANAIKCAGCSLN
jgi:hypothetical protein